MNIRTYSLFILPLLLFFCYANTIAQNKFVATELIVQANSIESLPSMATKTEILSERMGLYLLSLENEARTSKALQDLQLKESISYVDYNYFIEYRDTVPNEISNNIFPHPHWNYPPNLKQDVNALDAWDFTTGGTTIDGDTIVLAVIDDGIAIQHPDLSENIWTNRAEIPGNGIDDDGNGYTDDHRGWNVFNDNGTILSGDHGTKVAGIMGAVGNNNLGVVGANWHTQLMPICLGDSGTVANVIEAYEYILTQRERYNSSFGTEGALIVVSNNSFGLRGFRYASAPFWCDFIDTLGEAGIITVSAAPNETFLIDEEGDLPTVCPSDYLITTAALNLEGEWMNSAYSKEHIDLAAPGERVSTTVADSSYGIFEGTSAASAIVSGLVGLMYAEDCGIISRIADIEPSEGTQRVREYLLRAVDERPFLRNKTNFEGFVDYYESLLYLNRLCDTCAGPNWVNAVTINDTLILSIDSTLDSVQWLLREEGRTDWDTLSPRPNDTLLLPMGTGCENLELSFIEYCDSIPGPRYNIISLSDFKDCESCSDNYCIPKSEASTSYWIKEVTFEPELKRIYTGNDLGYGNYSDQTYATLYTDSANAISLGFVNDDTSRYFNAKVWLDVDQNGEFEEIEMVGESAIPFNDANRVNLDIPFTSEPGNSRLRIGLVPVKDSTDLLPCGLDNSQAFYEDYCVEIVVRDPVCRTIDSIATPRNSGTSIDVEIFPELIMDEAINVRYRKTGETEWEYQTYNVNPFKLVELEGSCTSYEFQARRVCTFDTSAYSEMEIIETECMDATDYSNLHSLQLYPNPFSEILYVRNNELIGERVDLSIFDLTGKRLLSRKNIKLFENQALIRSGETLLEEGVYLIRIVQDERVYSGKFIKLRQ